MSPTHARAGAIMPRYVAPSTSTAYVDAVLADSPSWFAKMDDVAGTVMLDSSGNSFDGNYFNSPTKGVAGLVNDGGTAVTFDGISQYAHVNANGWMVQPAFTIECVLKTTATGGMLICRDNAVSTGKLWDVQINGSNIQLTVFTGSTGQNTFSSGATVNDGNRHHVACTVTTSATQIYIDGTLVGSGTLTGANSSGLIAIDIARRGNGTLLAAVTLDMLAFYPTVLTGTRIAAHAAAM